MMWRRGKRKSEEAIAEDVRASQQSKSSVTDDSLVPYLPPDTLTHYTIISLFLEERTQQLLIVLKVNEYK
jgi:hypothetical protein